MTRFPALRRALASAEVEFVIVGGVAAAAHGSPRATQDFEIVYGRNRNNLERVAAALSPLEPYLRDAPAGLPFRLDRETLAGGLNFALTTRLGWIDLLGEIEGGWDCGKLLAHSFGFKASVVHSGEGET